MEITETEKYCIITPLSPKLDLRQTTRIKNEIECHSAMKVCFDLSYVNDCTIEFIEYIKNLGNICLFNIPSDLFAIINCMNIDKNFDLYSSREDFLEQRHKILNRKFTVVK